MTPAMPTPPFNAARLGPLAEAVAAVRLLSVDAIEHAGSGHPGICLGAAPVATVLWREILRHDPSFPGWPDRDRFVLSAGHGSMLLYSLLALSGYGLGLEELRQFRRLGSRTPGHPEFGVTPGVEATTGPLGQGAANAVGMAMAEAHLAARFNRPGLEVVRHRTWALLSDGDMMEGVVAESAALAGHLALGRLTFIYDANQVSLEGPLGRSSSEDTAGRFRAYGWQVLEVADGDHDLAGILAALEAAIACDRRPTLVVVATTIGYGAPTKAGLAACHGSPLGAAETAALKRGMGADPDGHFVVDPAVVALMGSPAAGGAGRRRAWEATFAAWAAAHPDLAGRWAAQGLGGPAASEPPAPGARAGEAGGRRPPADAAGTGTGEAMSTREASRRALAALAAGEPGLVSGDADLASSTLSRLPGSAGWRAGDFTGANVNFGVREHAMGATLNGMAYHGGIRPLGATFLVFSDYMRPSIRLAALSGLPVILLFSHDSIGLGEDGPTHQPVEHLMALRAICNLTVIRPADAQETFEAWRAALAHREGPVALVVSRQCLPAIARRGQRGRGAASGLHRGAYVLAEPEAQAPAGIIIASGSEVHIALAAQASLAARHCPVRVVSMPSWEIFAAQSEAYRAEVLPPSVAARLAIEAGVGLGWERWVGDGGAILGVEGFGASGPGPELLVDRGLTPERAAAEMLALVAAAAARRSG